MPTYANTSLMHLYENFGDIWIKRETGDVFVVDLCLFQIKKITARLPHPTGCLVISIKILILIFYSRSALALEYYPKK